MEVSISASPLLWMSVLDPTPVEDLMPEKCKLAPAGFAVSRDDALSHPGADDLLVGMQQISELVGVQDRRHFRIPPVVVGWTGPSRCVSLRLVYGIQPSADANQSANAGTETGPHGRT